MKSFVPIPGSLLTSLLRCAALLIVSAAVATTTYQWRDRIAAAQMEETERRDDLEARIRSAASNAEGVEAGAARYRDLMGRGIVGPERRADWLEYISREREQGRVLDVEYEIHPLQPLSINGVPVGTARHDAMASTMKIKLGLLHEQDFVDFLDDAHRNVSALLRVQACRMERAEANASGIPLRAECEIDWITLREKP